MRRRYSAKHRAGLVATVGVVHAKSEPRVSSGPEPGGGGWPGEVVLWGREPPTVGSLTFLSGGPRRARRDYRPSIYRLPCELV